MGTESKPKQCRQSQQCTREASRLFSDKQKEYLKAKIEELETNSKIKNIRVCTGASMVLRRVASLESI